MRSAPVAVLLVSLAILSAATPAVAPPATTPGSVIYPAPNGLGDSGGEPSLGVNAATGAVFLQAFTQTLRVEFDDSVAPASATWSNVAPSYTSIINVDPIAFTDQTTGRTFAGGLENACSLLAYTDDDGSSWTPMAETCTAPAFDHPTIASGPFHDPAPPTVLYPHNVYYCTQGFVQECATSFNGGVTFNPPVVISTTCTSAVGHVKIATDGTAYVPAKNCGVNQAVMVSTTNGLTWTTRPITGSTLVSGFNDPSVATTPSGWLYASWIGSDRHVRVALSKNDAISWSSPVDVAALAGIKTATFPAMVAGDDDRAAVAFLGTTDTGNGFTQSFAGTWDLYVAYTYDAAATWTVVKVTQDPVQRGWICTSGTSCDTAALTGGTTGRNLLDFMDASVDTDGRVLVAFADGCVSTCATTPGAASTAAKASIARQACGPSLFAAKGGVDGGAGCPTGVVPPPGPALLSGTYYATGLLPVNNVDGLARIFVPFGSFTQTVPGPTPPKLALAGAGFHGSNAGQIYDAHWFIDTTGAPLALDATTVTARLHLASVPANAATTTTLRVSIYDGSSLSFANISTPIATQDVLVPAGVDEVVVTFGPLTAELASGFELYADVVGNGEAIVLYDSALTPTSVEFS